MLKSDLKRQQIAKFNQVCRQEPRLAKLLAEARSWHAKADPTYCRRHSWNGSPEPGYRRMGIKGAMTRLVGWFAEGDGDSSPAAYELAYDVLLGALPRCGGLGCCCDNRRTEADWPAEVWAEAIWEQEREQEEAWQAYLEELGEAEAEGEWEDVYP